MLTNHPVNLNAINTGAFSADFDDKVVHKFSEISISTGSVAKSSKAVTIGLEWYHMFDLATKAVVYLFTALHPQPSQLCHQPQHAIRKHISECVHLALSSIC